jgi:hypothetical protein
MLGYPPETDRIFARMAALIFSRKMTVLLCLIVALAVGPPAFSMVDSRFIRPPTPPTLQHTKASMSPPMLSSGGDTAWIQVYNDSSYCPGDPLMGHGGEARGGPGPTETWCFEGGPGDSCGTNPPWDVECFSHEDVRAMPSELGINYWHVDPYRADQRAYCGGYSLWCGSDSIWDGYPVECGTWTSPPGYGDSWNCVVQLTLPDTFDVANGCTLFFDPRYDTECKYDYLYVDLWDGLAWVTLATFNATSNNPGGECGQPSGGNPDFWGNTDIDRLTNVDWQERNSPLWPAFVAGLDRSQYAYTSGPVFRWRFVSDTGASDASGIIDTDGGAWIDNVWVWGNGVRFQEDFESGVLDPAYWSLPDADGVIDQWHITHDPDPPFEGGDGGYPAGCTADSSYVYRARPEGGFPVDVEWRSGWFYRLMTPSIPITNSGCVVQYDAYQYAAEVTCDYPDESVRFFDTEYGRWCPWINVDWELLPFSGTPGFDINMDISEFMIDRFDSMQFAWDLVDYSRPDDFCRHKHKGTDFQVDNVSVGFYDASASLFRARPQDLLHDTFFTGLCGYNSGFDAYDDDTLTYYWHQAHALPRCNQLGLYARDIDQIASVELLGSIDRCATWRTVTMSIDFWNYYPYLPRLEGDCYGTLCPGDFGLADWDTGSTIYYYAKATDDLDNVTYFPGSADPQDPHHKGTLDDYLEFSVLPLYPDDYEGPRILLVNGCQTHPYYWAYDWAECLEATDLEKSIIEIYEEILTDAGYCYDVYDIGGAESSEGLHPVWFDDYDAVVWFTGSYSQDLVNREAKTAIVDYMATGGKIALCGDRLAYFASECEREIGSGCDSVDGAFLYGVLGCEYLDEMGSPFDRPYAYSRGVGAITVLGSPVAVDFDSMLVYRECPYPRDMSWVKVKANPYMGFTAQPLLMALTSDVALAHHAIYTEYMATGQCVFLNFDLSASINHERTYCMAPGPEAPPYIAGSYEGRVDLMRLILEDIFGLAPTGGGSAGIPDRPVPPRPGYTWSLAQNSPNPCTGSTAIVYEIAAPCRVRLAVYNAMGQVIRVLADGPAEPGRHTALWDGRGRTGGRVASGVYFYRVESGGFVATRKMLVLR